MKKEIIFKDPGLTLIDFAFLLDEDLRQLDKWGVQKHSPFEWLAFLAEEVGELAEAITEFVYRGASKEHISKEAISVATLALKIARMAEGLNE